MANDNKLVNLADLKEAFDDVNSRAGVTGVKGNAESGYRQGNVNLTPANIGAKPAQTAVADPTASGTAVTFIDSITQNANGVITPTKKTVRSASQSESGLMSATDKAKLDGIAAGAQVNSLTGVKGNAESAYRQGNVNLTPANIAFIGMNPTGGTSNDTREWWANKGTCYASIFGANQVNGQPADYGFLISIVMDSDVHQEWWTQPNGAHYHRGGNNSTSTMPGWTADDTNTITSVNGQTGAVSITPENIGAFKQIPGYVTREMLNDYNIKYWYGGRVIASDAVAIGLPSHEWFVLNMSKDDDTDSSWTRQVFYQLGGSMIYERTCSYHTWSSPTMVCVPVSLNLHDGSREAVLAEIYKIEPGYAAPIFITSDGCSILTGTKLNMYMSGIIVRTTPTSVAIMAFATSTADAIYTWSITDLTTDPFTVRPITKYTGTVI